MSRTKLAPKELLLLSKPALADLVWALALNFGSEYLQTVRAIVAAFEAHEIEP